MIINQPSYNFISTIYTNPSSSSSSSSIHTNTSNSSNNNLPPYIDLSVTSTNSLVYLNSSSSTSSYNIEEEYDENLLKKRITDEIYSIFKNRSLITSECIKKRLKEVTLYEKFIKEYDKKNCIKFYYNTLLTFLIYLIEQNNIDNASNNTTNSNNNTTNTSLSYNSMDIINDNTLDNYLLNNYKRNFENTIYLDENTQDIKRKRI